MRSYIAFEWVKDVKALGTNKARIFFSEIIFENGLNLIKLGIPLSGEMIFWRKEFFI